MGNFEILLSGDAGRSFWREILKLLNLAGSLNVSQVLNLKLDFWTENSNFSRVLNLQLGGFLQKILARCYLLSVLVENLQKNCNVHLLQ